MSVLPDWRCGVLVGEVTDGMVGSQVQHNVLVTGQLAEFGLSEKDVADH